MSIVSNHLLVAGAGYIVEDRNDDNGRRSWRYSFAAAAFTKL